MDIIQRNFGMEAPRDAEEELRLWLENRVSFMLEHQTDLLLSTLYRLDIDEQKIKEVMLHPGPVSVAAGLTELVLERQRERNATKNSYPVDTDTFYWGDEE